MAADPYKYFRVEARELLAQLGAGVLELEREGVEPNLLARLLRFAHTLKGAARVVKQPEIASLAHEVEDVLAPLRDKLGRVPRERLEGVLARLDGIDARVQGLSPPPEASAPPSGDEFFRTLRTDVSEVDALLGSVAETQTRAGGLRRTVESLAEARRLAGVVALNAGAAGDLQALLIDLEGRLADDAERLERELQEVRSAGERLRLLPVSALFGPLERAVRDAARTLGKLVAFRTAGGDVRLDGHVLQTLQAAFLHVVRNSVAHGIEPAEERKARGKPAEGRVVVEAVRRGARVAFVCRDDGGGVDLLAVRHALVRKGLLAADAAALAPEELLRLLLQARVSTSSAVTDVSGRGVGLDVVRDAGDRLGAQVEIRTEPGQGTTIEIVVPVSLSSVEGLVVEAADGRAIIPLAAVIRTLRLGPSDILSSPEGEVILYEDAAIPFVPLARLIGGNAASESRDLRSGVVLSGRTGAVAIGVDRLLQVATVLVRALPALAPVAPIVAGVAIDAFGSPRPVLDPDCLVEAARHAERAPARPSTAGAPILVVDDSLTTRMLEQSILESAGYTVDLAISAEEALEKARLRRYGLFLVDVEMPGMDGFVLLEHFRADPELQRVPCILVTSRNAPEDRRRGLQAGAQAYVVKSEFDQVDLLRRIRALMP